jgi:hypothetical protein
VVLPATPFLFFFFLLKTKANLKLQNLEFENSDRHEPNFVGKYGNWWGGGGSINFRGATPQNKKPRKSPNSKMKQVV